MGMSEELAAHMEATGESYVPLVNKNIRWVEICVCGHEKTYHGLNNGGTYGGTPDGIDYGMTVDGCAGALPGRDRDPRRIQPDGKVHVVPTCPCPRHRPVAEIDRPWRHFHQKVWTKDRVHPMTRGLKAMITRLNNSKTFAGKGAEEMDRRFRWIDNARECRVCGIENDTVWPSYVNDGRLSQMRCEEHRQLPIGEAL